MLQTETQTVAMERRVYHAARTMLGTRRSLRADFEHGQWWITDRTTGAQWSVIDAEGAQSVDGFDFERVTEGDEL